MATETQSIPAFSAFENQLKTLCLKEFPCGAGTWREPKPVITKTNKHLKNTHKVEGQFFVTLKDYGAQHEKTETLQEYVGSITSPWHLDYSWSQEARQLREISVKSPWLIDDNFVLNHFRTLRIVNKSVTEVDPNLLKFQNLEELTLSCNYITNINSKNLPPNLKVLEICANNISDLAALCVKPPKLIHLGLGYNKISMMGDYLTGQYWPYLLSLDLSNNNLNDLLDVVNKLGSLPKLRNLILQGNPLSLIPGYRGYTVDSLKKLAILDDIMISADERHYYKGLSRRREYILDEAKIKLGVTYIKGIPTPEEIKNPDEQPEFPVIERRYFVQFNFLEDATTKPEAEHVDHEEDELNELQELTMIPSDRSDTQELNMEEADFGDQSHIEKNVLFTQEPDVMHTIEKTEPQEAEKAPSPDVSEKKTEEQESAEKPIKLAPVNSEKHPWGDDIEVNWSQMLVRDDLMSLRDFFKQGMEISVVEEMVLCYPVIPEEPDEGSFPNPKSRRGSSRARQASRASRSSRVKVEGYPVDGATVSVGKSAGKNKKEIKDSKEAKSGGKEKGGGDKKKKKEPEQELKKNPPTYQTLATWHVPLAEFLEGEFEFQSVYSQGNIEIANTIKSLDTDSIRKSARSRSSGRQSGKMSSRNSRSSRQDGTNSRRPSRSSRSGFTDADQLKRKKSLKDGKKQDSKDKVKKPPSAGKKKEEGKDKSKDRKPSASKSGKGGKEDKSAKGGKAPPALEDEEDQGPPPPLEIHITVNLHHWKTAMDLLKDEEEKNKQEEPVVPVTV